MTFSLHNWVSIIVAFGSVVMAVVGLIDIITSACVKARRGQASYGRGHHLKRERERVSIIVAFGCVAMAAVELIDVITSACVETRRGQTSYGRNHHLKREREREGQHYCGFR